MYVSPLFLLGMVMCLGTASCAAWSLLQMQRQRNELRTRSDNDAAAFRQESALRAKAARAKLSSSLGWEGQRELRVGAIVEESPDTKSFYLTAADGMPLPSFLPGQYLTISAPVDPEAKPQIRCYSLSDRHRSECYRISVKKDGGPTKEEPNRPYGKVSGWLHENLKVGDHLHCNAPQGAFFYDPATDRPVVLIGAGVGATPIMSMLASSYHHGHQQPIYAFLTYRNGESHLFKKPLREIDRSDPLSHVTIAYSRPNEQDRLGIDYQYQGRINLEALTRFLPSNNFDYYLCGPGRMMQELVPELLDWGVPDDAIHYEAFGPATVTKPNDAEAAKQAIGCEVRFSEDRPALTWDGSHGSLLEMAEANDVPVSSGCRVGNCGACRMRVVEGTTTMIKKPGLKLGQGECLACISKPSSALMLEA